jgi:hypothetical protein
MTEKNKISTPKFNNKHTDDLVDHYWGTIEYLTSLVKASELKAGILLSFYGILFNLIHTLFTESSISLTSINPISILTGIWIIIT